MIKSQNLRKGATYYRDGRPEIVVLADAELGPFEEESAPLVRAWVRFRDGGQEYRYFGINDDVDYENIDPREDD